MKTKLMALALLAGGTIFAQTRFSVGVNFGAPVVPAPFVGAAYRPSSPGPGYVWIDGARDARGRISAGYWSFRGADRRNFRESRDRDRDRGFRR